MKAAKAAIVISAHEWIPPIETCLSGHLEMVNERRDLILVDNGSRVQLGAWAAEKFPGVSLIRLEKNNLFCGGYNAGIRLAMERGYDFILISNADTEVINCGFLKELLRSALDFPGGAFFGPKVFWQNRANIQKTCLDFPNVFRNAWFWLPWRIKKEAFDRQEEVKTPVEFLNGVCVLCRVTALKEIGLMDENMGGYMEDADWAWRAREKGWSSVFNPVPSIVHHEDDHGYEPYSLKTFLLKRNTVYWYLKIGRYASAVSYAKASLLFARGRFLLAEKEEGKNRHAYFLKKLQKSFAGLLRHKPLGEWFGPPLGPWLDQGSPGGIACQSFLRR